MASVALRRARGGTGREPGYRQPGRAARGGGSGCFAAPALPPAAAGGGA